MLQKKYPFSGTRNRDSEITRFLVAVSGFEPLTSEPGPLAKRQSHRTETSESAPTLLAVAYLRFLFGERTGPPAEDSTEPQVVARCTLLSPKGCRHSSRGLGRF